MKYDPVLAAMLAEPWSNNACRGYVIYELHYVFDFKTLDEAQHHYENGPY